MQARQSLKAFYIEDLARTFFADGDQAEFAERVKRADDGFLRHPKIAVNTISRRDMRKLILDQSPEQSREQSDKEVPASLEVAQQASLALGQAGLSIPGAQQPELAGPWNEVQVLGTKRLTLEMDPVLYQKMVWVTENIPKMSLSKLAKAGAEAEANRLIAIHYQPE